MKLYEQAGNFARLFDDFDAICSYEPDKNERGEYIDADGEIIPDIDAYRRDLQEAWFDTLDGLEEEFEVKAESIGAYIKELRAESDALRAEEASLSRRRKVKDRQIEWLKGYLLENMAAIGRAKIDRPKAVMSVRNNPESVEFDNEEQFIRLCIARDQHEYLRYREPELNKTAVKKALQSGGVVDGARLIRTKSLMVK